METYSYLKLPFVEIEIRFGTLGNTFDSSVDKVYFNKIGSVLESGQWVSVDTIKTEEFINDSLRLIEENGKESILMMKEKIQSNIISLKNSPFDIKYSITQEFLLNSYKGSFNKNGAVIRNKTRRTFTSNHFKYDLTVVNETINNIKKDKHEIEIELLVNKDTLCWTPEYINDFLECKIYDLINIVEQTEREKFKVKIL